MRLFSTFTGIGGLDYGLKDKCDLVGYSEIKESSIKIFKKYYSGKNYGDITKIDIKGLPDFDIITGGFPCQSFSLAGFRKGFEDKRGKMIFYLADILKEKKPKYFVFENVKGILNHNDGKTYGDIMKLFKWLGYYVRVLLLNAKNYGSAQSRERIIFLGSIEDFDKKSVDKIDDSRVFRDIRDDCVNNYKFINITDRVFRKIQGEMEFKYELIGGYDKVGTLTTQYGCGEKLVQYENKWRYLTPLECERLQGFPDGWTEGISDADRYFALGNAVNCNMSDYLFNKYLIDIWSELKI